jgi:hypothetical protein
MTARRVAQQHDAAEVEVMRACQGPELIHRSTDILVRPWPPTARLSLSAVLDVPAGNAIVPERVSHRGKITERGIRGLEAAAMDQDHDRMRPRTLWHAQLAILAGISPIGDPRVRSTVGKRHELLRRHQLRCLGRLFGRRLRLLAACSEDNSQRYDYSVNPERHVGTGTRRFVKLPVS